MTEKMYVGKCPYCEKELTDIDLSKGKVEVGVWTETKIFRCIHCEKIIAITHNKFK